MYFTDFFSLLVCIDGFTLCKKLIRLHLKSENSKFTCSINWDEHKWKGWLNFAQHEYENNDCAAMIVLYFVS